MHSTQEYLFLTDKLMMQKLVLTLFILIFASISAANVEGIPAIYLKQTCENKVEAQSISFPEDKLHITKTPDASKNLCTVAIMRESVNVMSRRIVKLPIHTYEVELFETTKAKSLQDWSDFSELSCPSKTKVKIINNGVSTVTLTPTGDSCSIKIFSNIKQETIYEYEQPISEEFIRSYKELPVKASSSPVEITSPKLPDFLPKGTSISLQSKVKNFHANMLGHTPKAKEEVIEELVTYAKENNIVIGDSSQAKEKAKEKLTPDECQLKLFEYFSSDDNKEAKIEYMKIQAKITLHRLAWTYLKILKDNPTSVEIEIKELLKKRNPSLHQQFIESSVETNNKKLFLAMEELKIKSEEFSPSDSDSYYGLKHSDSKMVELLAQAEKTHGGDLVGGVMDFSEIVSQSIEKPKQALDHVTKELDRLKLGKAEFEEELAEFLDENNCGIFRVDENGCDIDQFNSPVEVELQDSQKFIDFMYKDFEDGAKDDELKEVFQWNTFWLESK